MLRCPHMPSARKEAQRFFIPLGIIISLLGLANLFLPWMMPVALPLMFLFLALFFFVIYFFRDPERVVPTDENIIVSAADGLVVGVDEMEEPDFSPWSHGPHRRLFSPSSMSTSTARPSTGVVKSTIYKAGQFLDVPPSRFQHAQRMPPRGGSKTAHGPVAVRQIAGTHRPAHRRLVRRGLAAGPRPTPRHDPVWIAHRSLPSDRLHRAGQTRRPRGRRRDAHRPLARNRLAFSPT